MATPPRGRPPSQAPPAVGRGRNALTALGGGVLVLAVAGGAWALFGRDSTDDSSNAIGPVVPTSAPANPVFGPVAPKPAAQPTVSATSTKPVAAPRASASPAATKASTPAPAATAAARATKAPTKAPTAAPATAPTTAPTVTPPVSKPVVTPPVSGPQQTGTVAKRDYTFKVARGDTLWNYTKSVLASTGRSTSNANVAVFVTKLYQSNAKIIGSDPNLIFQGQTIVWPAGI